MAKEIKRKPTIIGYIPEEVKEVEEPKKKETKK